MIHATVMAPQAFTTADAAVDALKSRNPDAIAAILGKYQTRLYRFLSRMLRDSAAAEDVFQQTWLRIIERIGRYNANSNFETWMFTIARNLAIDYLRQKKGRSLDEEDQFGLTPADRLRSESQDALDQLLEWERSAALAGAIARLPLIHREVITLRFEEDLKLEQIAEVVGIPLSTVKSRLGRALENLRISLNTGRS